MHMRGSSGALPLPHRCYTITLAQRTFDRRLLYLRVAKPHADGLVLAVLPAEADAERCGRGAACAHGRDPPVFSPAHTTARA